MKVIDQRENLFRRGVDYDAALNAEGVGPRCCESQYADDEEYDGQGDDFGLGGFHWGGVFCGLDDETQAAVRAILLYFAGV